MGKSLSQIREILYADSPYDLASENDDWYRSLVDFLIDNSWEGEQGLKTIEGLITKFKELYLL